MFSMLTLGIYSAWAKVRMKAYFYQNTWATSSTSLNPPSLSARCCGSLRAAFATRHRLFQCRIAALLSRNGGAGSRHSWSSTHLHSAERLQAINAFDQ
ncbi:DUF898 domain-containing protein [Thalassobius sp. Cn5-15]|nr:DUF898 domain-containing protein [Thalassobius sp. Cn5-15]